MEQMSSASLEKLLLLDFYSPEEGGADMDKLYHAARLLAQREPQPPVDRAWAAFQEKYLPFAPFGTSLYEDGSPPSSCAAPGRRRRWLRTALAAAALAATLLLFCAAAGANGYDLWGILARWTDEQLAIEPDQIVPIPKSDIHIPEEPEEYSSLQEALSACGLSQPLAPSWMPEGFELSALHVEDMSELGNVMFAALYARDDSHLTIFINVYFDTGQYSTSPSTHFQKDEGDPVPYTVGGVTHMLMTTAGRPAAVWASGPAECSVTGDITTQELKQIIDSIYCGQ